MLYVDVYIYLRRTSIQPARDTPEARYDRLTDRVATLYEKGLQPVALDLLGRRGSRTPPVVGRQPEPAAGVVVLAPALRELPVEAQGELSPASILIGTDYELLEVVDEAAEKLAAFGLTIHRLPGLDHEVPADLVIQLRALLPGSAR